MRKSSNGRKSMTKKMEVERRWKTEWTRNGEEKESEGKGERWTASTDDERTGSEGVIKQKEGVRESRVSRVGMRWVEEEEGGCCARPGTQSSGRGDV